MRVVSQNHERRVQNSSSPQFAAKPVHQATWNRKYEHGSCSCSCHECCSPNPLQAWLFGDVAARTGGDVGRRAKRALQLTQWGKLSSARQALEGALVPPRSERELDPSR